MHAMMGNALLLALRELRRNVMRSILTMLGIIIGVAAVIILVTLGSGATLIIELSRLPLIPGAENLVGRKHFTRASKTNREYVQGDLRIEGSVDPVRLEFFYDAQTSGGLLISVPAERAEVLVQKARQLGASGACVIGEVAARREAALVVKM